MNAPKSLSCVVDGGDSALISLTLPMANDMPLPVLVAGLFAPFLILLLLVATLGPWQAPSAHLTTPVTTGAQSSILPLAAFWAKAIDPENNVLASTSNNTPRLRQCRHETVKIE